MTETADNAIAIIGLGCRLPSASSPDAFWRNLIAGRESISFFDDDGTAVTEPIPAADGECIRAAGILEGSELFDAQLFGYSRQEATLLDPQQRVFLECAYEALDAAGYDPHRYPGSIGVYAGGTETSYLATLRAHRHLLAGASDWQLRVATGVDFLTSRVAHKLGLRGPALTLQTACSTSLVAVHIAAQSLLGGDCDMALAGGVSVTVPFQFGTYTEGGILSSDGRCRAFDLHANGTVIGEGACILVLKRLADAIADGDHIHALLLGSAINNDASAKVGFTAPGVEGQFRVIRAAHAVAMIEPASIGYVEAHGTGTFLGDAVEVAALTRAFRGPRHVRCLLGSVKPNVGHTDAAAGAVGVLKAVLALEHGVVPPTLHFAEANPELALDRGRSRCRAWLVHGRRLTGCAEPR